MNEPIELIDKQALIEHLNTTFYRDVMEEIKRFPPFMKINKEVLEDIEKGRMSSIEFVVDRKETKNEQQK